ncbi:MAG: prephenate dehydratase [Spirochaetia bacterium]|nr:prephenate dehydratase [Spirochaetia bacterium]
MPEPILNVAYLGRKGSFASLVAKQRYAQLEQIPQPSVADVVAYVTERRDRIGIVPIENSSGGIIHDSVDVFVEDSFKLFIREETRIHVRYALLGRKGQEIKTIYSHYAALKHCVDWIRAQFPNAKTRAAASTSEAAAIAAEDPGGVAISTRDSALEYGLEILEFPILEKVPNVTQFFTIGHERADSITEGGNTSLVASLSNQPGSLFSFLKPFHDFKANLNRIQSRAIPGRSDACKFFVGIEGLESDQNVHRALELARPLTEGIRVLGSYPRILAPYES